MFPFLMIKKITIFNLDFENYVLSKSKDKISKQGMGYFKKAIQLSDELVATSDDDHNIDIWIKAELKDEGYFHLISIILYHEISDILSVNSESFISSQNYDNRIYFYDIESLSIEKSIKNIPCLNSENSLFLFQDEYIIVNCVNGFARIYIKTKEFVQLIEDYLSRYDKKELYLDSNNYIYVIVWGSKLFFKNGF